MRILRSLACVALLASASCINDADAGGKHHLLFGSAGGVSAVDNYSDVTGLQLHLEANYTPADMDPDHADISANLVLWLKDDATTKYTTADCSTTAVSSDGDAIACWADQSGGGHDVTQDESGKYPLHKTSIINGKDTVRFDGVNDHLQRVATPPLDGAAGATAFVVFQTSDTNAGKYLYGQPSAAGVNGFDAYLVSSAEGIHPYIKTDLGTADKNAAFTYSDGAVHIYSIMWDPATNLLGVGTDGFRAAETARTGATIDASYTDWEVGGFNAAFSSLYYKGDIAEIALYDTALTPAQRHAVENGLKTKYAVTLDRGNDGDSVSEWLDQSSALNHMVQATAANQPTLQTNEINSKPVVRFDGTDDTVAVTVTQNQPYAVFAVFKAISSTYSASSIAFDGTTSGGRGGVYYRGDQPGDFLSIYAGGTEISSTSGPGAYHYTSYIFNGASSEIFIDGTSDATGNPGAHNHAGHRLGCEYDGVGNCLDMDMALLLIYDPVPSEEDRQSIEAKMAADYGL